MKSNLFFLIVTSFFVVISFGSDALIPANALVGEWQLSSSIVGSNKLNTYLFFKNNKFEYHTNSQDALIEIIKISGTYSVKHDTVYVRPTAVTRRVGGHLSKNFETPINDFWELSGGTIKTFKLVNNTEYPLIIKIIKTNKSININGSMYYRI